MGTEFAVYCPTTPREKIAPVAAGPANVTNPSKAAQMAVNNTPRTGVPVVGLIL
jgi:hypothetical protein